MEHLENYVKQISVNPPPPGTTGDTTARNVLEAMHEQNPIVLTFGSKYKGSNVTLNDATRQHVAEKGLKEILDVLKSVPILRKHLFSASILAIIIDVRSVRKYLWKDSEFIDCLIRMLNDTQRLSNDDSLILRGFVADLLVNLLREAPSTYFEMITNSGIFDAVIAIFKQKVNIKVESNNTLLNFLFLSCLESRNCALTCEKLDIKSTLRQFLQWQKAVGYKKNRKTIKCILEFDGYPEIVIDLMREDVHSFVKKIEMICLNCAEVEPSAEKEKFKKCSRCKVALYCSKKCQTRHWLDGHSKVCTPPPTPAKK